MRIRIPCHQPDQSERRLRCSSGERCGRENRPKRLMPAARSLTRREEAESLFGGTYTLQSYIILDEQDHFLDTEFCKEVLSNQHSARSHSWAFRSWLKLRPKS